MSGWAGMIPFLERLNPAVQVLAGIAAISAAAFAAWEWLRTPDPFDMTGNWTLTNTVIEARNENEIGMELEFRVTIVAQDGNTFSGSGALQKVNGEPRKTTSAFAFDGLLRDNRSVVVSYEEQKKNGVTYKGGFDWNIVSDTRLDGTYWSDPSKGVSTLAKLR